MDAAVASVCVAGIAALASIGTAVITTRQSKRVSETHRHVSQNGYRDPDNPTLRDEIGLVRRLLVAHIDEANRDHDLLMQHLAEHGE